jgi:hypothetical protein
VEPSVEQAATAVGPEVEAARAAETKVASMDADRDRDEEPGVRRGYYYVPDRKEEPKFSDRKKESDAWAEEPDASLMLVSEMKILMLVVESQIRMFIIKIEILERKSRMMFHPYAPDVPDRDPGLRKRAKDPDKEKDPVPG